MVAGLITKESKLQRNTYLSNGIRTYVIMTIIVCIGYTAYRSLFPNLFFFLRF